MFIRLPFFHVPFVFARKRSALPASNGKCKPVCQRNRIRGPEPLECRAMLSSTLILNGTVWDRYATDWKDFLGHDVAWSDGARAVIPAAMAGMTVNLSDSGQGSSLIWAESIEFQAGLTIQGSTANDVLAIDPSTPLTLTVNNSTAGGTWIHGGTREINLKDSATTFLRNEGHKASSGRAFLLFRRPFAEFSQVA
jgi:hypothetical protein